MTFSIPDVEVLFIAGFDPIAVDAMATRSLYLDTLHLPLKPLAQASQSCCGTEH